MNHWVGWEDPICNWFAIDEMNPKWWSWPWGCIHREEGHGGNSNTSLLTSAGAWTQLPASSLPLLPSMDSPSLCLAPTIPLDFFSTLWFNYWKGGKSKWPSTLLCHSIWGGSSFFNEGVQFKAFPTQKRLMKNVYICEKLSPSSKRVMRPHPMLLPWVHPWAWSISHS